MEHIFNTEYTDDTKPQGDTEFLKEHGNPQKRMPTYNSKFKVQNSKLWLGRVDEWTGWQVNKLFVLWNRAPQSRDRRPRLSAPTFHVTLQEASLMRTDEGVCPYFEAGSLINERDLLQFKMQSSQFKIVIR